MVRARLREHLEALQQRFPQQLGDCEIQQFLGTDYAFRLFTAKRASPGSRRRPTTTISSRRSAATRGNRARPTSDRSTTSGR
jgi:hypothetical protein